MGNPVTINANDYPPGIDISHAIATVKLQKYTHNNPNNAVAYEDLLVESVAYSPVGQPNILAWTTSNTGYERSLGDPQGYPLSSAGSFAGLSIASTQHKISYFYFTAFSGSGDPFDMFLFDNEDRYITAIDNIAGVVSNNDANGSVCASPVGPPCYSFCFGSYFLGLNKDVYRVDIGSSSGAGSINSLTLTLG